MSCLSRPTSGAGIASPLWVIAAWSVIVGVFLVILSFRARSFGKLLAEAKGDAAS